MEDKELVGQMLKMASDLSTPVEAAQAEITKRPVAGIQADFEECCAIVAHQLKPREKTAAVVPVEIDSLPGLSPMQIKAHINRLVDIRHELEVLEAQNAAVLKKLKNLEKEEKAGVALLKKAGNAMSEKGAYIVKAEKGLLRLTAYLTAKRPGPSQMLGDPKKNKVGDKAGELIQRIAEQQGEEIAEAVEKIYYECLEDLTHMADAVNNFKVVSKNASLSREVKASVLKKANISKLVTNALGWLGGAADSMTRRIMNFGGDIVRWVKGFTTRTVIVKNQVSVIDGAIDSVTDAIDQVLPD